jgi:hypothetical protein
MMPMLPQLPPPQAPDPKMMELLNAPSWEDVMQLLRNGAHREYRIDIETDSTIASSIDGDMAGIADILKAVGATMQTIMPMVQSGMLPAEAAKEVVLMVTRRGRMGNAMEDAIDKMQAPQPHQDPVLQVAQIKAQADQQKAQAQAQADAQAKQMDLALEQQRMQMEARFEEQRAQNEMRIAQAEQAYQAQQDAQAQQMEHQREMQRQAMEQQAEQMRQAMEERQAAMEQRFALLIARENNAAKIEVAEIAAQTTLDSAQISAAKQAESGE